MIQDTKIEAALQDLFGQLRFTAEPAGLYDPLRYMIAIGGKRIRPRLCLTAYSLYQDTLSDEILEPAAGLEIFHTFTLIHDDVMDRSPLRRGHETVWKKWNGDTAILSGDVMCIESYRRMARAPKEVLDRVLVLFSDTAAEVCDGQQYDMEFEALRTVPMTGYMRMIGLKTAVLIACAAKMGAVIGGAPAGEADALYRYGYDLGLAFQVADDYLDAYGDAKVFGKPIGGDIVNDKKSWLYVRAMEKAAPADQERLLEAMRLTSDSMKVAMVKDLYAELGIAEDAKAEILRLHTAALSHVSAFPAPARAALKRYADALLGRTR